MTIELKKLQTLAEAKGERAAVDQFFNKLEDEVEQAYNAIGRIRTTLQSKVLSDMVKRLGHPATESKEAQADAETAWTAIRGLEEEVNDLYRALATSADDAKVNEAVAAPAKEKTLDELKAEEKKINKILANMEQHLHHDCRYKEWDADKYTTTVRWITQESNPEQGKEAAKTIAKMIRKAGIKGWTVKVTIRDDYTGEDKTTKWQGKSKT